MNREELRVPSVSSILGLLRQRECDVNAAGSRSRIFSTASGNHDVLAAIYGVGDGCGVPRVRQRRFPEKFSRGLIERTELLVVVGCADEEQASRGDDWAAVIF